MKNRGSYVKTSFVSKILACLIVIAARGQVLDAAAQTSPIDIADVGVREYLIHDDLKGLLKYCGSEERAIDSLLNFKLGKQFHRNDIWFVIQDLYSQGPLDVLQFPVDAASRELQALYWIIRIYEFNVENNTEDSVCVFRHASGRDFYDYRPLNDSSQVAYLEYAKLWRTNSDSSDGSRTIPDLYKGLEVLSKFVHICQVP